MKHQNYFIQLDGLRFFAVLMVMIAHWLQWQWGNPILTKIPFGHGVILFFVLSGFLITRILLTYKEKYEELAKNKWRLVLQFYKRRFLRIFPLYYGLIFFLFIIDYDNTRTIFPWLISYTSNIYQSIYHTYINSFNHFWSLAVEEQFYLFWPILLLFIPKKQTLYFISFTVLASLSYRIVLYTNEVHWMQISYSTIGAMQSLGLGALLAYISIFKKEWLLKLARTKYLIAILLFYVSQLFVHRYFNLEFLKSTTDEFFFSLLSCFIIIKATHNGFQKLPKKILENKTIRYLGQISYALYVFHLFIPKLYIYLFEIAETTTIKNKYIEFILFFIITVFFSHLSWKFFEGPINRMKKKVPYIKED